MDDPTELIARLWRAKCGDAPFTVVTVIALAQRDKELHDALLLVAPDRFGFGGISQNMLTRWFKSQEGARLYQIGAGIWQYDKETAAAA